MMNQNLGATHTSQQSTHSPISTPSADRLGLKSCAAQKLCTRFAVWAVLTAVGLFAGAVNSHAQADFTYTNTAAFGTWNVGSAWVTNGGNSGEYPGDFTDPSGLYFVDGAYLTNAGTFYIKFTANVSLGSNFFSNASGTVSQVTLDLGTFNYALGDTANAMVIGDNQGSTTIVYLASSTFAQGGVASQGAIVVGRNGVGSLYFTNGYVATLASSAAVSLGTGDGGHGHLVISGPNTSMYDLRQMSVGDATNVNGGACSVVVSNSAFLRIGSSFRMGSGSGGGASSNTFLVDSDARVLFDAGHAVIGKRGGTQGSYDNIFTVQGGASCSVSNHSLGIGFSDDDAGPGTGNVLVVMANSAVTNCSTLNLRNANFINLYGGAVGGNYTNGGGGSIQDDGILQGYGSIMGSISVLTNGALIVSNTVAALSVQHDFLMTTNNAVLQMALGTNFNSLAVGRNIMLSGKLNLIDGGGFTCGAYTLITYSGAIIYTNATDGFTNSFITVGTTPDNTKTYVIDTNTTGQVNLTVSGCGSGLPFVITSITRSGANVTVNWNTKGTIGQTNFVQASPGTVNGSYPGTFVDIATNVITGSTATFTDVGGVTGPNKYYRIRSPQ